MAHIVIIGGDGVGILPMAYQMADLARAQDRVTVVSRKDHYRFAPLAPWIFPPATGRRAVEVALGPNLEKKGIAFVGAGARRLHPERNQLELEDGTVLDYDFVVITTGPKPAFEEIEGLGPNGFTQSFCHPDDLPACARAWKQFVADPGPIIVGAVQGASCLAPAYESAFRMEADLRRRGLRDRATMTFLTAEPYIGHLGLDGMAGSQSMLEKALRARGIPWITHAQVDRVEHRRMYVTVHGAAGSPKTQHVLPFKYAMLMPPFKGIDAVSGIDGLANERGFILIDEFQRNPKYRNIYAAGVSVASATAKTGRGSNAAQKKACMVESMVLPAAYNIRDELDGRQPSHRATWHPVCLADLGAPGLAFIGMQDLPEQKSDWFEQGDWLHMPRCSECDVGS